MKYKQMLKIRKSERDPQVRDRILLNVYRLEYVRDRFGENQIYRRVKVRDHSSGKPGIGHLI